MEDSRSEETRKYIGIHMMAMSASAAKAVMQEGIDSEEAFNAWQRVCERGKCVLEHPEATEEEKATALNNFQDGILGMGKALYDLEEDDQVVMLLEGHKIDERTGVILGLAYFKAADPENPAQYISCLKKAYPLIQVVERDQTLDLDSKYLFFAFFYLKSLYLHAREFPQLGIVSSMEAAYNCMVAASKLPDLIPDAQTLIASELKKFHKGFLGGYTYRG